MSVVESAVKSRGAELGWSLSTGKNLATVNSDRLLAAYMSELPAGVTRADQRRRRAALARRRGADGEDAGRRSRRHGRQGRRLGGIEEQRLQHPGVERRLEGIRSRVARAMAEDQRRSGHGPEAEGGQGQGEARAGVQEEERRGDQGGPDGRLRQARGRVQPRLEEAPGADLGHRQGHRGEDQRERRLPQEGQERQGKRQGGPRRGGGPQGPAGKAEGLLRDSDASRRRCR